MGWLTKGNLASSPAAVSRGRLVDPGIRRQAIIEAVYTNSRTHLLATLSAIVRARVPPVWLRSWPTAGADIAGKNPWPLVRPPARPTPETVATASLRSPRSRRASTAMEYTSRTNLASASKHHGRLPLNRSVRAPHLMSKTGEVGAVQVMEISPPIPSETSFSRVSSAAITRRRSWPRCKTRPVAVTTE
jgi:hypothetical protein